MNNPGCNFCTREGLPVLLVRPAIKAQGDGVPDLPASIQMPVERKGETGYTTRLLRAGFLYIWDELVNGWINYYVTDEGYYYLLPADGKVPPRLANGEMKPCIDEPDELARASLVTLPVLPKGLTNKAFWLAWSAVQWTDAVRKKHEDPVYRAQYMQRFDMEKWLNCGEGENALPFSSLRDTVAEYHTQIDTNRRIADYTSSHWNGKWLFEPDNLWWAVRELLPDKGVILYLSDPVAVVQDITALANYRLKTQFHENPHYIRGVALSASLSTLKEVLCRQFERDQLKSDETLENQIRYGYYTTGGLYIPGNQELAEAGHQLNNSVLKRLVREYWSDYEKYIDRDKEKAFMDRFTTDLTRYDNTIISPMTEMYLDWLKSQLLLDYFDHNFDSTDDYSGALFVQSVHDCVAGMQDKLGASRYFQEQMMSTTITPDNLLLRALVMNSDKRIEQIHGVLKTGGNYGSLAWDKIPDGLKDIAEHFDGPVSLTIEKYLNELSSTLFAVMNKAVEKVPLPALVVLAKLHGKELKVIKFVGKRKHFISAVVAVTSELGDLKRRPSSDQLRHYVDIEMRRLKIDGLPMEGDQEFNFIVLADAGEAEKTLALPEAERAKSLVKTLHSVDEIRAELFPGTLLTKLAQLQASSVKSAAKQLAKVPPFIGCTFSMVLQISALRAAGWPEGKTEACTRFAADLVAAMGAIAETCERLLNHFQVLRLKPLLGSILGENLLTKVLWGFKVVKIFGAWAGIVGVVWDIYHVIDEIAFKGNMDLGIAYLVSAISGGFLFVAAIKLITLGPWGIILALVFFFGANIYLEMKKKNEIQKWLVACLWRKIPAGEKDISAIWPDSRMELDAFNKLMTSAEA
ncbi:hypothetical protein EAE91_22745 [Photorhabdus noenieputensis]|uniref:T6SS effector BTH_I2691 family protein n=1 Tax=Photorhabdus noenieputensis TaxID=1208607 RepID=UPI001BD452A2|nr:T6SS effector BTH_I2691 family protein [Photorhabdus noenieputensis]MBS9439863.1 hypothetical protein [Photorhabdus noenieputensis]MCK3668990.1 hypothetical protein [Photorhabdus noenieputensis]